MRLHGEEIKFGEKQPSDLRQSCAQPSICKSLILQALANSVDNADQMQQNELLETHSAVLNTSTGSEIDFPFNRKFSISR